MMPALTAIRSVTIHPQGRHPLEESMTVTEIMELGVEDIRVNLRRLRPQVEEGSDARFEAGCFFIALKIKVGHGSWQSEARASGYSVQHARKLKQLAQGVLRLGLSPEAVKGMSIDRVNRAVRVGRKAEYEGEVERQAELHADPHAHPTLVVADAGDYLRGIESNSVPFVISDPPFGIGKCYADWTEADNPVDHAAWVRPFWEECRRVVAPGGTVVFFQHSGYLPHFQAMFPGCLIDILPVNYRGSKTYVPLLRWTKPGAGASRPQTPALATVLPYADGRKDNHEWHEAHPCPKNSYEVRRVVRHYATPGSVVLDPFLGTGTIAAEALAWGCVPWGCDRNPEYVRLALARLARSEPASTSS